MTKAAITAIMIIEITMIGPRSM